jgi:hypothetical protein
MRSIPFITFIFCLAFLACNNGPNKSNTLQYKDSFLKQNADSDISLTNTNSGRKIFGERLKMTGDFDGDGKKDTVFESYISELTGKETFKILDSTDWEENMSLVIKNAPVARLYSSIKMVDTFIVTDQLQQIGISFIENLGDLNNDKGDEIGYIIDWADESNLNHYHILTLSKNKKWKELFNFPINESVNYEPEYLFKNSSIINKTGNSKISYKFYSDSATVEEGTKLFH